MKRFWKDEKGISPIVGVILVVAMTVMLAIIAWNYLGGMAQTTGKVYNIGVKVQRVPNSTSSDIIATYVGGPDNDKVTELSITFVGCTGKIDATPGSPSGDTVTWSGSNLKVGNTAKCWNAPDNTHVIATATFSDGTQQVIYDSVI